MPVSLNSRGPLADLGKDQIFLVGTIGERFAGVRTFHVERSFNGTVPTSEIVIVFKEGPRSATAATTRWP